MPSPLSWPTQFESQTPSYQSSRNQSPRPTLTPGDSFSHQPNASGSPAQYSLSSQPAIRPDEYPPQIIWLRAEIPEHVQMTPATRSRPPMSQCLQGPDGRVLSPAEYTGVKEAVHQVFLQELAPLATADEIKNPNINTKRSTAWYKDNHREKWRSAIAQIEYHQAIVGLCANHWKAEQLLLNTINAYIGLKFRRQNSPEPRTRKHGRSSSVTLPYGKKSRTRESRDASQDPGSSVDFAHAPGFPSPTANQNRDPIGGNDDNFRNSEVEAEIAQLHFIKILCTYENLRDILRSKHGSITNALPLLDAVQANPNFKHQTSSPEVIDFVKRIEEADPSAKLDADDLNEGWGHYQFTAGGLTCHSVLRNWEAIGNAGMVYRLIAAAIKTCQVARSMCELRGLQPGNYLSDTYLDVLINRIWDVWRTAEGPVSLGKGKQKAGASATEASRAPAMEMQAAQTSRTEVNPPEPQAGNLPFQLLSLNRSRAHSIGTATQQLDDLSMSSTSLEHDLQAFTVAQLKDWLVERRVDTLKSKPKTFYIQEIMSKINPDADEISARLKEKVTEKSRKKLL
ncbi:hypothetical protein AGABI1DRAFT_91815 [Agaricus bisporus var. burnettii JB137-S8]|uniref:Uncharacterized protein n=1 Tax=Agaricus bisporus var. burnettii (strain JB137-S8 / ATCC MYA-4627 / FGSC 10392) TaxID=597362 RepID=K5VXK1_AGABU|nr:uncharacterized protein AGABI1DRAFT_91815 [Agaricus bisporus var. burnettii JB137-S8]EKM79209.1 hypothetical protein AGABI1DRAFT_91815 [Agaricus bisporus var. burnettii JB137-S8]